MSKPACIAINGLGRVGRAFLKLALQEPQLDIVAVNDLADPDNIAYLIKYDSVYRRYEREVAIVKDGEAVTLVMDGRRVRFLREREPSKLPWGVLGVDVVVEATGAFASFEKARAHIRAGARRVVLSAPAKDEDGQDAKTVLAGVNMEALRVCTLSSNGSCTTNSASPVMQVLGDKLGVLKAILNTVHGFTPSQSLVDAPARGRDWRKGRAGSTSIVPSTTGAAIAVARAIPALKGKFDGVAMRVPVPAGSLSAIVFLAARATTTAEINEFLEEAAGLPRWRGTLAVTREPLVSADIIGQPHAAIVDLSLTKVVDHDLCAVYIWYDNEFGYANSLLNHVREAARAR